MYNHPHYVDCAKRLKQAVNNDDIDEAKEICVELEHTDAPESWVDFAIDVSMTRAVLNNQTEMAKALRAIKDTSGYCTRVAEGKDKPLNVSL
jgi:hypothetical protein